MDWDERAQSTHERLWEQWFEKLSKRRRSELAEWVSGFRNGLSSEFVDTSFGAFNFCCRVRFADGIQWIVRLAMPGKVMDGDAKVLREVAAMRLIKEKTRIPVPTIHAWGFEGQNSLGLGPFIIMDYIEGVSLGKVWNESPTPQSGRTLSHSISDRDLGVVYRQVTGFLLELDRLELPRIGSLGVKPDGTVHVDSSPLTLKLQEIEAHGGVRVGGDRTRTFSSSTEYFSYIADQDSEHLEKQLNSVDNADDARVKYQFRKEFKALIPQLVSARHEKGPFKLICDDMRPGNMLVNNTTELKIIAVLDWEWTYSAPYQMFYSPPRWLLIKKPINWTSTQNTEQARYMKYFQLFLAALEQEETERGYNRSDHKRLSELMQMSITDGKFWFHELLYECFEGADNLAWQSLCRLYPSIVGTGSVPSSEVDSFVERKMNDLDRYAKQ